MGDEIAKQYGGSNAHHSSTSKKKNIKLSIAELMTSVKRHYANNFLDPQRQNIINLFLGIYVPMQNQVSLWDLDNDLKLHKPKKEKLTPMVGKWWEPYLRKYETQIPEPL
jgi:hypothetical protein